MHSVVSAQRQPVVIGVDGSRNHLATVDLGVAEAVRRRAPLLIVHVWPGRYSGPFRSRGPLPSEADGRRLLEVAARRAAHTAPQLDIDTELAGGGAASALVERSAVARLMVVGHRDDVLTRPSWGSTAAYLAHHCACPLLVQRGGPAERGPVVLAASAEETGAATVAAAYQEAELRGSRLVAIHVWTHPGGPDGIPVATPAVAYPADRQRAERALAEALAGWAWSHPDVEVERVVLHDLDVAYTLERAARRGRVLVAGMGRTGRFAEMLYGTLGLSLGRAAPCPVLLIPPGWPAPAMPAPAVPVAAVPAPAVPPAAAVHASAVSGPATTPRKGSGRTARRSAAGPPRTDAGPVARAARP